MKMRLVLEGKISEDSAIQFDEALETQTREEILRKLKVITGTKGGKGKKEMKIKKSLKKRLKFKFIKHKKNINDMDVAELTGSFKKQKFED